MLKASELRKLSVQDLEVKIQDLRKEHFGVRQAVASRKEANTARIRQVRKDIARALMVLAEKRRAGAAAE